MTETSGNRRLVRRCCAITLSFLACFWELPAAAQADSITTTNLPDDAIKDLLQQLGTAPVISFPPLTFDWRAQPWNKSVENTGEPAFAADFPWQFGLAATATGKRCGATLIGSRYLLTAAHCVDRRPSSDSGPPERMAVAELAAFRASDLFGDVPVPIDPAWPVQIHPNYKAGGPRFAFDAAVLRLAAPVAGARTAPVGRRTYLAGPAVATGWGDHPDGSSGVLRAERIAVVANDACRASLPEESQALVQPATICANDGAASCGRDSGGPLVAGSRQAPQLIGIVSWGYNSGCGMPDDYGRLVDGYTRTSALADWVAQVTGDPATVVDRPFGTLMNLPDRKDM